MDAGELDQICSLAEGTVRFVDLENGRGWWLSWMRRLNSAWLDACGLLDAFDAGHAAWTR